MEATEEQKGILERVVINAMRVISNEDTGQKVSGFLSSGKSQGEGFSSALSYVLQAVIAGMLNKGVEVTPEILLSENGAASQVGQLLVAMIEAQGGDITPNEIQKGLEVGIQNFGTMMNRMGGQQEGEPQQPPQAAPPQPLAQAPQGMLAGRNAQPGGV